MDSPALEIFAAVLGLLIGSFLSVCVYRIPAGRGLEPGDPEADDYEGTEESEESESEEPTLSIFHPARSFCPSCEKQLLWYHNIPLFSWLIQRGKCAFCKSSISFRYPLLEIMSSLTAVGCVVMFGPTPTAALIYVFCASLLVASFIDFDYYILPNSITLNGIIVGFVIGTVNQFTHIFARPVNQEFMSSFWGFLIGGGILFAISEGYFRLRKKEGLGMGDVKLMAMVGSIFGAEAALFSIFLGSLFGSVVGGLLLLFLGRKWSQALPFGPYLALGSFIYLFGGPELPYTIVNWFGSII